MRSALLRALFHISLTRSWDASSDHRVTSAAFSSVIPFIHPAPEVSDQGADQGVGRLKFRPDRKILSVLAKTSHNAPQKPGSVDAHRVPLQEMMSRRLKRLSSGGKTSANFSYKSTSSWRSQDYLNERLLTLFEVLYTALVYTMYRFPTEGADRDTPNGFLLLLFFFNVPKVKEVIQNTPFHKGLCVVCTVVLYHQCHPCSCSYCEVYKHNESSIIQSKSSPHRAQELFYFVL